MSFFFDGDDSIIDWFIWEPVDTAMLVSDTECVYITDPKWRNKRVIWDTEVPSTQDTLVLKMPVSRFGLHTCSLAVPAVCTLYELLTAIYNFYDTPISLISLEDFTERCWYVDDAREKLKAGSVVKWRDLLGSQMYGDDNSEEKWGNLSLEKRRHPFSCNGRVRFETIRNDQVYLGS